MILWVLVVAAQLQAGGPFIAFNSQEKCHEAADKVTTAAVLCIPFASDVPLAGRTR